MAGCIQAGTLRALAAATLAAAMAGCVARRPQDQACVYTSDCAPGLVCNGGYCRGECQTDRDCLQGYRCVPGANPMRAVCVSPSSPVLCRQASDCEGGYVCNPNGLCAPSSCRTATDCAPLGMGAYCANAVCVRSDFDGGGPPPDVPVSPDASPCVGSACDSCRALLASSPGLASGRFELTIAGARTMVDCDMETDGGGWTLIFFAESTSYNSTTLGYTVDAPALRGADRQVLLAYRRVSDRGISGPWARFAMPARWVSRAPFAHLNVTETVQGSVSGAPPVALTLYYGFAEFSGRMNCDAPWELAGARGRVCIAGTNLPFFNSFANSENDYCATSDELSNNAPCDDARRFSIAVR